MAALNAKDAASAPSQTSPKLTFVFGMYLYSTRKTANPISGDAASEITRATSSNSTAGKTNLTRRSSRPIIGATYSRDGMSSPAPAISPKSMRRSRRNGLGFVIPQALLIPLRIAPNTAQDAQSNPRNAATEVIGFPRATLFMFSPMKSVDTGMTCDTCAASASRSLSPPRKNPHTDIIAKTSGNIENSE